MIIKVKVHSNSSRREIIKLKEEDYEIYIKEKAEDNKANITLLKLLENKFKKKVKIIKGLASRNKIIEIK